ncbi:hypothetical protein ACFVX9_24275 [Kitasatospora sp. NPDC058243]|uniref:hypothetical protein n=1 Tax=Kitasatospora sp. NPDC058243 TaxID=3346397 RepID=UPI0036DEDB15
MELLVSTLGPVEADAAALLAAGRGGGAPAGSSGPGPGLLYRRNQLAVPEQAAGAARAGRGAVVLVRSGAGIGKTSLVNVWAAAEQARGIPMVRATIFPEPPPEHRHHRLVGEARQRPLPARSGKHPTARTGHADLVNKVLRGLVGQRQRSVAGCGPFPCDGLATGVCRFQACDLPRAQTSQGQIEGTVRGGGEAGAV